MTPDALNRAMVERLRKQGSIRSQPVARAFLEVPRHHFLTQGWVTIGSQDRCLSMTDRRWRAALLEAAYQGEAIATRKAKDDYWWTSSCSSASIVAILLESLCAKAGERILEIGAGTGWHAALLSRVVGRNGAVCSVDIAADIVRDAARHLRCARVRGVRLRCGDGKAGWPAAAPFDRIVATVAVNGMFPSWRKQLAEGGTFLAPFEIQGLNSPLLRLRKRGGRFEGEFADHAEFMHLHGTPDKWKGLSEAERKALWALLKAPPQLEPLPWAPAEAPDNWAHRLNFMLYLHLTEPQACAEHMDQGGNWRMGVGLWDRRRGQAAFLTPYYVCAWGGPGARSRLLAAYCRWHKLGRPRLEDWRVAEPALRTAGNLIGCLQRPGITLEFRLPERP